MTRVVIDETLKSKLVELHHEVELRDESGRLLGYFIPTSEDREVAVAPIVLDEATAVKLRSVHDHAELCDTQGTILGRFVGFGAIPPGFELPPPLSEEEWQRRLNEPSYTTAEVLAYLKSLECSK